MAPGLRVGLLGYGVVGRGVAQILDARGDVEIRKILRHTPDKVTEARMTANADEILDDPDIDVIIECMGGLEPAHTYVMRAMQAGKHVVTANKKMLATHIIEIAAACETLDKKCRFEACVGGGIPWIHEILHIRRIDAVTSFRGIFNGTTNYILTRMTEEHASFAEVLAQAQAMGFAEQDPTDDVDGFDARYKGVLTCAAAFGRVPDPEEVPTFGIRGIAPCDLDYARVHGRVIKLVARGSFDGGRLALTVVPTMVREKDPLASVHDNFNGMEAESTTLGRSFYAGQGAGSLPTAHAMVQDLLSIPHPYSIDVHPSGELAKRPAVYYVRGAKRGPLAELTAQDTGAAILTKPVSLQELKEHLVPEEGQKVFAAEIES